MRAELDRDVYLDYRDKFLAGVKFPPIDVYHDGSTYWLADGFHRFYGAREAKRGSIEATVHQGTVRDAILCAVAANQANGLRRTNADKRNCVLALLNDEAWVQWSDQKIADHAGVSQMTVTRIRDELKQCLSSPAAKTKDEPRTGRDGKRRRPKRRATATATATQPRAAARPANQQSNGSAAKPERSVFVSLRAVFDEMTPAERQTAIPMWQGWIDDET